MIFSPVMPMPMPRTISPKMRKMIDLFLKGMRKRSDMFDWPGPGKLRSHTGHFSAVRTPETKIWMQGQAWQKIIYLARALLRVLKRKESWQCAQVTLHIPGTWKRDICWSRKKYGDVCRKLRRGHHPPEGQKQVWVEREPGWWSSYSLVCAQRKVNVTPIRMY